MGHNHPPDRTTAKLFFEYLAPGRLGVVQRHAGVDNGPAFVAVIDQPEIDPLQ